VTQVFNKPSEKQKRRSLGTGSPRAELLLWSRLRGKQLSRHKFRRQYNIGAYVVDFYCPALRLAIEVDGDSHYQDNARVYDEQRQTFIESFGIRFLRFTNDDVFERLDGVLAAIEAALAE